MTIRMQAGVGAPVPAKPPVPRDASLDTGTWFDAATPHGALRLCAFTGRAVRHAVDAAIALEHCEELLVALEAWTGIALDWRWNPAPPRRPSGSHAAASWEPTPEPEPDAAPNERVCLLSLPWTLLRAAAPPDAGLRLRWSSVPAVLAVAHFKLAAGEADLLEVGGAVVLPDSMRSPWLGRLRSADEPAIAGLGARVLLDEPSLPRLVRGAAAEDPSTPAMGDASIDERIACEVRLALPHTLPGDMLTGWHDGVPLADAGPRATLWRCAGDGVPAQGLAAGRLMPWGDGWALAIESLETL